MFVRKSARSQLHNVIILGFFVMLLIFLSFPSYASYVPSYSNVDRAIVYFQDFAFILKNFDGSNSVGSALTVKTSDVKYRYDPITSSVTVPSRTGSISYTDGSVSYSGYGTYNDVTSSSGVTTGYFYPSSVISTSNSGAGSFTINSYSYNVPADFSFSASSIYTIPVVLVFNTHDFLGRVNFSFTFDISIPSFDNFFSFNFIPASGCSFSGSLDYSRLTYSVNCSGSAFQNYNDGNWSAVYIGDISAVSRYAYNLDNFNISLSSVYGLYVWQDFDSSLLQNIASSINASPSVPSDYGTVNSGISAGINNVDSFESNVFQNFDVAISDTGMDTFSLSGLQAGFSLYSSIVNSLYEGTGSLYKTLITLALFCIIVPALLGITHKIRGGGG